MSVILAACGSSDAPSAPHATGTAATSAGAAPHAATLRTLIDQPVQPGTMTVGAAHHDAAGSRTSRGRRFDVTYTSGDLSLSAILDLPTGKGPFPAVVLVHGYIAPSSYNRDSNTDIRRQEAALVDAGYATLALDLRGYAESDSSGSEFEDIDEVGFAQDVASAVVDLAAGSIQQVDPSRVALIGHSRGGRMVLDTAVLVPDALKAVVAMSPTSVYLWDDLQKFNGELVNTDGEVGWLGNPATQPAFWKDLDPATFAGRATEPVLLIQGGADEVLDPSWAADSVKAWKAGGGRIRLAMFPGADHNLDSAMDAVMRQTIAFLGAHV
jgi:dipeptidyl aminopeptidase/acylaminoacyl peptidase